jgi:hypothetical protein
LASCCRPCCGWKIPHNGTLRFLFKKKLVPRVVIGLAKRSYDLKSHRASRSFVEYQKILFDENQINNSFSIPAVITATTMQLWSLYNIHTLSNLYCLGSRRFSSLFKNRVKIYRFKMIFFQVDERARRSI